jgi:1-acyl-sn-glycerol-3-phosphate acyltransferase
LNLCVKVVWTDLAARGCHDQIDLSSIDLRPEARREGLHKFAIQAGDHGANEAARSGADTLLRVARQTVDGDLHRVPLLANHSSHLDTVSLLNLFPLWRLREIQPVAAADYFERNRLVAWFSHTFFNILPIARCRITPENNPIQRMLAQLRAGKSLIIYPEGTRGSGEEIGPIRPGIAHLLEQMPGLPVVPVYLVNHGRCLPKGEWLPVPLFCEIRIGPPQVFSGGSRREILERLRSAILSLKNVED